MIYKKDGENEISYKRFLDRYGSPIPHYLCVADENGQLCVTDADGRISVNCIPIRKSNFVNAWKYVNQLDGISELWELRIGNEDTVGNNRWPNQVEETAIANGWGHLLNYLRPYNGAYWACAYGNRDASNMDRRKAIFVVQCLSLIRPGYNKNIFL